MKPILIGTSSYREDGDDIDLIDDVDDYKIKKCDDEKRYDIQPIPRGSSNEDIYRYLNASKYVKTKVTSYGEVIILPEILNYILLKSHIHRILPKTRNHLENVKIWEKSMYDYTRFREKMDYLFLDSLIYDDRESFYSKLFFKRFEETNLRVGDTKHLFDDSENFFKDNVKRVIPHDILHKHVALLFRDSEEPLFTKFIISGVEMDETLFLQATRDEQIQTLIEEICVLIIERHLIPYIMRTQEIMSGENLDFIFRDARSHFICNLCGSGHYWLRNFCLNHWSLLTANVYRLTDLQNLTIRLLEINVKDYKPKYTFTQLYRRFMTYVDDVYRTEDMEYSFLGFFGEELDYIREKIIPMKKKLRFGVDGKNHIAKNYILFDCTTKKYYSVEKLIISSSITLPDLNYSLIIVDDIKNVRKYLILINENGGLFYDGECENLLFMKTIELEPGHGEIGGVIRHIEQVDDDDHEIPEELKEDLFSYESSFEDHTEYFCCYLFNSTLSCGHNEPGIKYPLTRSMTDRKMMELFETYFVALYGAG